MATDDQRSMQAKLLEMARGDVQSGNIRRAVRHYRRLVALEPENAAFLLKLGDLSLRNREERDAVDAYARAAAVYARGGFDAKAIALYKRTLELDATRYDLWSAVANCYVRVGRREEALASLTIAAEALAREGRSDEADGFRERMAELGAVGTQEDASPPATSPAPPQEHGLREHLSRALDHARDGRVDRLEDAFRAAIGQRPARVSELLELLAGLDMSDVHAVKEALRKHLTRTGEGASLDRNELQALLATIHDCRAYLDGMSVLYREVAEIYRESALPPGEP